jgi:hypothetical protein
MIRFVDVWPDRTQVEILASQLGWSHFKELLYLENEIQRQFYAEMCRVERWSVRTLRERIRGMLFERTAISRKPEEVARQEHQNLRELDRTRCARLSINSLMLCPEFKLRRRAHTFQ